MTTVDLDATELARFWTKVGKTATCWLWTDKPGRDGYGQYSITRAGRQVNVRAHRLTYELMVGPINRGMVLDHICRVRHCVNPEHLRQVTNRENVLIGIGISAINARKTHCKRDHEFTPENTYVNWRGNRECRACKALLDLRHKQKVRDASGPAAPSTSGNGSAGPVGSGASASDRDVTASGLRAGSEVRHSPLIPGPADSSSTGGEL